MWVNIGSDNGVSPSRRQTITWSNIDFLSIERQEQTSLKFE